MKRIYLIDCPGVVPPNKGDQDEDLLLRGVVRVEKLDHPAQYVAAVMRKVQRRHLERTYDIREWDDATEFLDKLARKSGKLLKQGEVDADAVAKMVLNDFLRGKIPWFAAPPGWEERKSEKVEGRDGRLGEMGSKRKMADRQDEAMSDNDDDHDDFETFSDDDSDPGSSAEDALSQGLDDGRSTSFTELSSHGDSDGVGLGENKQ
jgi:nuclear GTP-binding protein